MSRLDRHRGVFAKVPEVSLFTPGRANLIGEHTDYNGGNVMPIALQQGVHISVNQRADQVVQVYSETFDELVLRDLSEPAMGCWSDMILGSVLIHSEGRYGYDIMLESDLPYGSGLSSSAALSVGVIKAVAELSGNGVSDVDAALMAQRVENDFIGVPCGIMDQFAVSVLKPGQCMRLDTRTLEYEIFSLPSDWTICIYHSGVVRKHTEGRYAERRNECDQAAQALQVGHLCVDAREEDTHKLPNPLKSRVRHQITENERVLLAEPALKAGDSAAFGALMNGSHNSMRDDFEISTPKIDAIVCSASQAGARGSRMTGGGFGGCVVSLVASDLVDDWRKTFEASQPGVRFITAIQGDR